MENFENLFHQYLHQHVKPLIQESVKQAVRQLMDEQPSHQSETAKKYLTLEEAAAYTRYATSTIYKMIHYRQIPRYGSKKKVLFKKSDLDAFISQKFSPSQKDLEQEVNELLSSKRKS